MTKKIRGFFIDLLSEKRPVLLIQIKLLQGYIFFISNEFLFDKLNLQAYT